LIGQSGDEPEKERQKNLKKISLILNFIDIITAISDYLHLAPCLKRRKDAKT